MIDNTFVTFKREPFFEIVRPYLAPDSKVLDIGPGTGNFPDHFGRNDFYLLEGNEETTDKLKKRFPNTVFGRLPHLPFPDATFDVIHCSHVVEHLQQQEFYDTLKEMDRCLGNGGVLVISAPLLWEGFYNDLSHVRPYNPRVYERYLCHADDGAPTRSKISSAYSIERIQYRYREVSPMAKLTAAAKRPFLLKLFFYTATKLRKFGLKQYETTGYTIILKKG